MIKTTFEDLGLKFDFDESCVSCSDGSCHAIVKSTKNGREYSVHISTNKELTYFYISAEEQSNTYNGSEINATFSDEQEAVDFVCKNFGGFKCF